MDKCLLWFWFDGRLDTSSRYLVGLPYVVCLYQRWEVLLSNFYSEKNSRVCKPMYMYFYKVYTKITNQQNKTKDFLVEEAYSRRPSG